MRVMLACLHLPPDTVPALSLACLLVFVYSFSFRSLLAMVNTGTFTVPAGTSASARPAGDTER